METFRQLLPGDLVCPTPEGIQIFRDNYPELPLHGVGTVAQWVDFNVYRVSWEHNGGTLFELRSWIVRIELDNPYTDLAHLQYWRPDEAQRVLTDLLLERGWPEAVSGVLSEDPVTRNYQLWAIHRTFEDARELCYAAGYHPPRYEFSMRWTALGHGEPETRQNRSEPILMAICPGADNYGAWDPELALRINPADLEEFDPPINVSEVRMAAEDLIHRVTRERLALSRDHLLQQLQIDLLPRE